MQKSDLSGDLASISHSRRSQDVTPYLFVSGDALKAVGTSMTVKALWTLYVRVNLRYNWDMWDVYLVQEIYESLAQQKNKTGAVQTQAINVDEHLSPVEDSAYDDSDD